MSSSSDSSRFVIHIRFADNSNYRLALPNVPAASRVNPDYLARCILDGLRMGGYPAVLTEQVEQPPKADTQGDILVLLNAMSAVARGDCIEDALADLRGLSATELVRRTLEPAPDRSRDPSEPRATWATGLTLDDVTL